MTEAEQLAHQIGSRIRALKNAAKGVNGAATKPTLEGIAAGVDAIKNDIASVASALNALAIALSAEKRLVSEDGKPVGVVTVPSVTAA